MDWWIWLLVGFVVWRIMGRGCACRPRRLPQWNPDRKRMMGRDAQREEGSHRRRPELLARRASGRGPRGRGRSRQREGRGGAGSNRPETVSRSTERPARPAPRETPVERLQRRFAEGRISLEQYERELDELLGLTR